MFTSSESSLENFQYMIVKPRNPEDSNMITEMSEEPSSRYEFVQTRIFSEGAVIGESPTAPFRSPTRFRDGTIGVTLTQTCLRQLVEEEIIEQAIQNTFFEIPHEPDIGPASSVPPANNWGFDHLQASWFHQRNMKGQGVRVGILDSGINLQHPTFINTNLQSFRSFSSDGVGAEVDPYDTQWHGTHVAGIIAGQERTFNRGLAPFCELSVGLVIHGWRASVASVKAGLEWMLEVKPDVLNLSLGWPGLHDEWYSAIRDLVNAGVIICIATGNEFNTNEKTRSPANYGIEGVITVGAINNTGMVWDRSGGEIVTWPPNTSMSGTIVSLPTITAPGVDIISAGQTNTFRSESGTSMACPHVVGLIACLLSHPNIEAEQIQPILESSIQDTGKPGFDIRYGNGILNAHALQSTVLKLLARRVLG